ncbi:hypothetical protein Tco_0920035, partial [Tanacetum coccineum]
FAAQHFIESKDRALFQCDNAIMNSMFNLLLQSVLPSLKPLVKCWKHNCDYLGLDLKDIKVSHYKSSRSSFTIDLKDRLLSIGYLYQHQVVESYKKKLMEICEFEETRSDH